MRLYLLRHGKAEARTRWSGDDGLRPLTTEGERAMVQEARAMVRLGIAPEVIITSPLVRALRTAEIVVDGLGMADRLVVDERLAHGFSTARLAALLEDHAPRSADASVMLVGHEPEFSTVTSELIGGGELVFKKGGLARIDLWGYPALKGELLWLLTPSLLVGE